MARKPLCGFALVAGLTFAIGCGGSSSAPSKSKEEIEKETNKMKDMQKDMQKGMTPPAGGNTAPKGEPEKK